MCTSPIYMPNISKLKYGGLDYVQCSCRHCRECSEIASADYVARALSLYESLKSAGNPFSLHFVTLTFDNAHIPRSSLFHNGQEQTIPGSFLPLSVPHFDHRLLKRFLHSLRSYFNRLGLSSPDYLITCEFGRKTQRPHYHIFFAIHQNLSYNEFADIVRKYWHYGFISDFSLRKYIIGSSRNRDVVNSIKYCCKYIGKYYQNLPKWVSDKSLSLSRPYYECAPRVFTSHGFGKTLLARICDDDVRNGKFTMYVDGKYKTFRIPYYIKRQHFNMVLTLKKPEKYLQRLDYATISYNLKELLDITTIALKSKDFNALFDLPYYYVIRTKSESCNLRLAGCDSLNFENWQLNLYKKYELMYNAYTLDESFMVSVKNDGYFELLESFLFNYDKVFLQMCNDYLNKIPTTFAFPTFKTGLFPKYTGVPPIVVKSFCNVDKNHLNFEMCAYFDLIRYFDRYQSNLRLHKSMIKEQNELDFYATTAHVS